MPELSSLWLSYIYIYLTLYSSFFRTQNLYCWSGQCRKNHNFVSVSDERGSSYVSNDWIQRGRSCLEKCPFYYVGSRRTRITQSSMEHLLLKYRSNYFFLYLIWHDVRKMKKHTHVSLDIHTFFLSNYNVHKSLWGLFFWALDPSTKIYRLKGLDPKNKGHTNFCINVVIWQKVISKASYFWV